MVDLPHPLRKPTLWCHPQCMWSVNFIECWLAWSCADSHCLWVDLWSSPVKSSSSPASGSYSLPSHRPWALWRWYDINVLCVTGHSTNSLSTLIVVRFCVNCCHLKNDLCESADTSVPGCVCTCILSQKRLSGYHESEFLPGTPACILLAVLIPHRAWVTGVLRISYLGARIHLCSSEQALTTEQFLWAFSIFLYSVLHHFPFFIFVCVFMYVNSCIGCVCARRDQRLVSVTSLITVYLVYICIDLRAYQFRLVS